jgi:hypothetical protein
MRKLFATAAFLFMAISAATADELAYLGDVITRPAYKHAITAIVAGQPLESWVKAVLGGDESLGAPGKTVTSGSAIYELYNVCQPHNCEGNFFYVLFTPGGGQAWALITKDGRFLRTYGNPNAVQQRILSDATKR